MHLQHATLVACVLAATLCAASATTLTAGESYNRPSGNQQSVMYDIAVAAESRDSSWILKVAMKRSSGYANVSLGGSAVPEDTSGSSAEYRNTVPGGSNYSLTVSTSYAYTVSVDSPMNEVLIPELLAGGLLLLIIALVLIAKRTWLPSRDTDDRIVINYYAPAYVLITVLLVAPVVMLVQGLVYRTRELIIIGSIWLGLTLFIAGHRSVDINLLQRTVTVCNYLFFVIPCRTRVDMADIENFALTVRSTRGRISHGVALQMSSGRKLGVSDDCKAMTAMDLTARLNDVLRRCTPEVVRPDPPLVVAGMDPALVSLMASHANNNTLQVQGQTGTQYGTVEQQQLARADAADPPSPSGKVSATTTTAVVVPYEPELPPASKPDYDNIL